MEAINWGFQVGGSNKVFNLGLNSPKHTNEITTRKKTKYTNTNINKDASIHLRDRFSNNFYNGVQLYISIPKVKAFSMILVESFPQRNPLNQQVQNVPLKISGDFPFLFLIHVCKSFHQNWIRFDFQELPTISG